MDILTTAVTWAKAEVFSSRFFMLSGMLFLVSAFGFWQLGKTEIAKALAWPMLVAGAFLLAVGVGIYFTNKARVTSFAEAYQKDPSSFVETERVRTEKIIGEYDLAVFKIFPLLTIAAALLIMFVDHPTWRAIGIVTIALSAVIFLVDSNANARVLDYHYQLTQAHKSGN